MSDHRRRTRRLSDLLAVLALAILAAAPGDRAASASDAAEPHAGPDATSGAAAADGVKPAPGGRHWGLDFDVVERNGDRTFTVVPLVYPLPVRPGIPLREQAVLAPALTLAPGEPVMKVTAHAGVELWLSVSAFDDGWGAAELEVRDGDTVLERRSQDFDLSDPAHPRLAPAHTEVDAGGIPVLGNRRPA